MQLSMIITSLENAGNMKSSQQQHAIFILLTSAQFLHPNDSLISGTLTELVVYNLTSTKLLPIADLHL